VLRREALPKPAPLLVMLGLFYGMFGMCSPTCRALEIAATFALSSWDFSAVDLQKDRLRIFVDIFIIVWALVFVGNLLQMVVFAGVKVTKTGFARL
jgi:hypothetical protein